MGNKHENLLQRSALYVQQILPRSRFIVRHVGMFKTMRGNPIRIGQNGQGDAYIIFSHNKNMIHVELEFKMPYDKQSNDQKNWEKTISDLDGLYILVREPEDIKTEMQKKWPDITLAI